MLPDCCSRGVAPILLLLSGSACGEPEPRGVSLFGASVALAGDILAVGDPGAADNGVHVFQRNDPDADVPWRHRALLMAPEDSTESGFGQALAMSADTLAIGAPGEVVIATASAPDDTHFGARTRLTSPEPGDDSFGHSLALVGDTLVVGAPAADEGRGAAYVFQRADGAWALSAVLGAERGDSGDRFGHAVAIAAGPDGLSESGLIAIGAPEEDSADAGVDGDAGDNRAPESGAVYLFRHDGLDWRQAGYLKASNAEADDRFGASVAAADSLVAVGAPGEASASMAIDGDQADNSAAGAGAVYVYRDGPAGWSQISYLKPSAPSLFEAFGHAVAIAQSQVAVLHGDFLHFFGTDARLAGDPDPWAGAWAPSGLFLASLDDTRRYCRLGPGCLASDGAGLAVAGQNLMDGAGETPAADEPELVDGTRAVYLYRSQELGWRFDGALTRP